MTTRFGSKNTYDEHEVTIQGEPYTAYRYQFEANPETDEAGVQGTEFYSADALRFETGPDYYTEDGVVDADGRGAVYNENGTLAPFRADAIQVVAEP